MGTEGEKKRGDENRWGANWTEKKGRADGFGLVSRSTVGQWSGPCEVVISQKISEMQADLEEIRFDRRSPAQSVGLEGQEKGF